MTDVWDQFKRVEAPSQSAFGSSDEMFPGINSSLKGDEYLKQFPQEIQSGVLDYEAGRTMPTGNPRKTNIVKIVAGKHGQDIGLPADDTSFGERRTLRNQMASGSPSSLGGQTRNGGTALEHLNTVAEAAHDLGNWNALGIAPLSHAVNAVRGLGTEQSAKMKALDDALSHYGEEITKFYAGSPGGEAERQRFLTAMNSANTPQELAAVIAMEKRLIPAKMQQIKDEIATKLGPSGEREYAHQFVKHDQHQAAIDATLTRMRGVTPAAGAVGSPVPPAPTAPQAAPGGAPSPPAGTSPGSGDVPEGFIIHNPKTGVKLINQGGVWRQM